MRPMRVGVIGRTGMLLDAARRIRDAGHSITFIAACKESGHESAKLSDFQKFAEDCEVPFLGLKDLTSAEGLKTIQDSNSDLAISMNWVRLIPASVRGLFRLGVFNAHPGDLPRFKGNACPNWAVLVGEPDVVLTIHQMEDALDAGPIASKTALALSDDVDMTQIYAWLENAVPEAFLRLVDSAANGTMVLKAQPELPSLGLRCYPRRPEDGCINWQSPIDEVLRLIRASTRPFGGAYTFLEGQRRVTIWSAKRQSVPEPFLAVPGQVAFAMDGDPVVAGNGGYIRLLDISVGEIGDNADTKRLLLSSLRNRLTGNCG